MDERELTLRAIRYLTDLAAGVNPLDGSPVPAGELLHEPRIMRCLHYAADRLAAGLDPLAPIAPPADGEAAPRRPREKRGAKQPLTADLLDPAAFALADDPIPASELTRRLNAACPGVAAGSVRRLSSRAIPSWLLSVGVMEARERPDGVTVRRPTAAAAPLGITLERRIGARGSYEVVLYDRDAQAFVWDNREALLAHEAARKEKKD